MTFEEVDGLDRDRTVVFLPLSPIEEHGPHLPLGTDFYGARDIADEAVKRLEEREPGACWLVAPGIPLGTTDLAKDFPGTLHISGRTLYAVVRDLGESLARSRFRHVIIANHHLDLTHIHAIATAARDVMARYPIRISDPFSCHVHAEESPSQVAIGGRVVDSASDVHAGARETSFIAYRYPKLVRPCASELPPVLIDFGKYFQKRLRRFQFGFPGLAEMGAGRGYVGSPALADPEFGKVHFDEGAEVLAACALKLLRGEALPGLSRRMRFVLRFCARLK
ncbi:MAG: creatininase family protein [Bryobacteraceae bacterium]